MWILLKFPKLKIDIKLTSIFSLDKRSLTISMFSDSTAKYKADWLKSYQKSLKKSNIVIDFEKVIC